MLFTVNLIYGQSNRARKLYSEARYTVNSQKKIDILKKAIREDDTYTEAYWLLAAAYKDIGDEANMIHSLKRAAYPDYRLYQETILRLGKAYFDIGQYEEAYKTFFIFDDRYKDWIVRSQYALQLKRNPVQFNPINLETVNTDYDDYWPSITADEQQLSITVRVGKRDGEKSYNSQEDIYYSQKDEDGKWGKSEPVGPPINTPVGNEGAQSFSVDGRYMFFVACDRYDGIGGCDIYYSIKNGDEWGMPINPGRPLNSSDWDSNPSFSVSGDELFFTSKRGGGKGGMDIWSSKVAILENGRLQFAAPVNLGDSINTSGDEISPFIHPDNKTLYFSSDTHFGLGGFDIFFARRNPDASWGKPKNLGYPINTNRDEIGLAVSASGKTAYFSSNGILKNGRGADIYEMELPPELRPDPMEFFRGRVYDPATQKAVQAQIEVFSLEDNKRIFQSISDETTGEFTAYLPVAKNDYGYVVMKRGHMLYSGNLSEMDSIINVQTEIALAQIAVGEKMILNNVFFDFDKYELKPKSIAELQRLIKFLKTNSNVWIELGGHTDIIGSREYNIELSRERAKVVADYLVQQGISWWRITYEGYGFDQPIADNETERGRAFNRRTEVVITKK